MSDGFQDTRWTLVANSRKPDTAGKAALSELCAAYYAPVVAFLHLDGRTPDTARELAHDFFAKMLAGGTIEQADPLRGKFRTYLLAALKHFLQDKRVHDHALKRGGGQIHADIANETDGPQLQDFTAAAPDA